ncbi:YqaE/Pmp3 family membrane protein [Ureibacillus sp. Re31]|uniref:YqaE/Pmp3 family membrane protein n=1 Tax=Ureibacillus galli TaxID=2762222 RepID=A0ABR8XAT7_9BACL|nr:YqaE/Pmp3 family membrane protein [Ureibacillus galli]MBD8026438.1 YqaE/Pmp3 family membrane protein [Ureibacillus galli]
MYLLAIFFPPIAVLLCGKPIQALISCGLTLLFWIPGSIHAILVVNEKKADKRMERQVKLMKQQ